jgi:hypothetical protein
VRELGREHKINCISSRRFCPLLLLTPLLSVAPRSSPPLSLRYERDKDREYCGSTVGKVMLKSGFKPHVTSVDQLGGSYTMFQNFDNFVSFPRTRNPNHSSLQRSLALSFRYAHPLLCARFAHTQNKGFTPLGSRDLKKLFLGTEALEGEYLYTLTKRCAENATTASDAFLEPR